MYYNRKNEKPDTMSNGVMKETRSETWTQKSSSILVFLKYL